MKSSIGRLGPGHWARAAALAALACCAAAGCSRSDSPQDNAPVLVTDRTPGELHATSVEFDGKLRMLGYIIKDRPLRPGAKIKMTMYWQAKEKLPPGYRPVTRLLDDAGERLLDLDSAGPLREEKDGHLALPVENWEPGKIYVDTLTFTVPRTLKTWQVQVVTGFSKGEEKLTISQGDPVDGLALVATSGTGIRQRAKRAPGVPDLRSDLIDPKVKLKIDGKLDEAAWKEAPQLSLTDVNTGKPAKNPRVSGDVKLLSNKDGFYVAFVVKDSNVIGGFEKGAKDAHLWTKDAVEIMIDPDGDGDNLDYYEIQINPQGLVFDTQYDKYNEPRKEPEGPFGHEEWTSGVKAAVTVQGTIDKSDDTDEGYTVEAFVPWKSFGKAKKTPPALGDTWRMNFYAVKENDGAGWSPILRQGNFHKASRFGRVLWADKNWTPPAETARLAGSAAPADSAAPASSVEAKAIAAKPLPSGIVERLQSAKPQPPAAPSAH